MKPRKFWISIRKAKNCLFSRRNGYRGRIILGYSIMIRLFGVDLVYSKVKKRFMKEAKRLQKETI